MKMAPEDLAAGLELIEEHPSRETLTVPNVVMHAVRRAQKGVKSRLLHQKGRRCEACKVEMADKSLLHLHHVVPVARGGTNIEENTILLCPNCHATAHYLDRTMAEDRPKNRTHLLFVLKGHRAA